MAREIVLIDLSSIAYPIWHTSQSEPDPNHASTQIVARVRALANGAPHVAICCDAGRSFRKDIAETYKANRPEEDGTLKHQIALAADVLLADGFPVWSAKGFEADDVIAAATEKALALDEDTTVVIVSADKDLLQLVGDRVKAKSVRDGSLVDPDAVKAKFGVTPAQMLDFLCLVGDSADNVKGAPGIGEKSAADLLARHGSLDAIYERLEVQGAVSMGITPAKAKALHEFDAQGGRALARRLIALSTDPPIDFDAVLKPRALPQAPMATEAATPELLSLVPAPARDADVLAPAPEDYERQLDPRSMRQAQMLAEDMFKSRMFSAYGSPQAVLSTVMVGRELGLPAMASLRCIYNLEGKHALAASLMVGLVLKAGIAEYFEPIEVSETSVTYETKRKGARNPMRLTHTIEMAKQAWPIKDGTKAAWGPKTQEAWDKSGWGRVPTDMLVARCSSRLARMIYPDLLAGLYTPEELAEVREAA